MMSLFHQASGLEGGGLKNEFVSVSLAACRRSRSSKKLSGGEITREGPGNILSWVELLFF